MKPQPRALPHTRQRIRINQRIYDPLDLDEGRWPRVAD